MYIAASQKEKLYYVGLFIVSEEPAVRPSPIRASLKSCLGTCSKQCEKKKRGAEKGFKVRPMRKADPPSGPPIFLLCFLEGSSWADSFSSFCVGCQL